MTFADGDKTLDTRNPHWARVLERKGGAHGRCGGDIMAIQTYRSLHFYQCLKCAAQGVESGRLPPGTGRRP